MKFYLGTHQPAWLARTVVPLFVSHLRLRGLKKLPRAICSWALDSGGFSEIDKHGKWTIPPREYVAGVRRYHTEIEAMEWAAPQDWMCEPPMLKKTGLTVREHQRRTIDSYVELMNLGPNLPWVPVLQGYEIDEYRQHVDDYADRGIDLAALPRVGVGTVCRRQATMEIALIFKMLASYDLKMHGLA